MSRRSVPLALPLIGADEREAVDCALRSVGLPGAEVEAFEGDFAAYLGVRSCVAVNSGTNALLLTLLAHGVGRGDEVLLPAFTFAGSANAVALTGARPVFVDIEPDHFCVSPAAVRAAVTDATTAVMAVHLYGHPCDMSALTELANAHGLLLIEDAAQAHGASWQGRKAGTHGDAAAFSFYRTKNMTTLEGGMVVTDDDAVARSARLLRNQGMERPYENEVVGYNMRMTDVSAAVGRVQLRKLDAWNERRRTNAEVLTAGLAGTVQTPSVAAGASPVFHQYTVRTPRRDEMREGLAAAGVGTGVYYPTPAHRLPAFVSDAELPETDRAADEVLSLPVHPGLTEDDLAHVVAAVTAVDGS